MAAAFFSKLPSIAYPPEQHGRWSPVTSTLDWCEEVSGLETFVDVTIDCLRIMSLHSTRRK